MFGLSLPKLLLTAAVIAIVWYGFRWLARMNDPALRSDKKDGVAGGKGTPKNAAEDMTPCRVCGAFVPASGAQHCGRDDCPYPG